jgi:hypothetical protein
VHVRDAAGQTTTLPISATTDLALWQQPSKSAPTPDLALWWSNQLLPMRLCLPAAMLAQATTLQIESQGAVPIRQYQLVATADHDPDLVVSACPSSASPPPVRYGRLQSISSGHDARPGQALALDAQTSVLVRHVLVLGSGDDPSLPVGQARVLVSLVVTAEQTLDWPSLAPTLLLASGEALLPTDQQQDGTQAELSYLIPTPIEPNEALWSLTTTATARPLRWRVQLPPPRSRDLVLRSQLVVESVALQPAAGSDGMLAVVVRVRNSGTTALILSPADLLLSQGDQQLPIPALPELTTPILPQQQRSFSLTVAPPRDRRVLYTLTIGAVPFTWTVPATEGRAMDVIWG